MKVKAIFKKLGSVLDSTLVFVRRAFVFIILVALAAGIIGGLSGQKIEIPEEAILVLDLNGPLVEEFSQTEFEQVINEFTDSGTPEILLSDLIKIIEAAKNDERIKYLLLDLEHFGGGNPSKLQAVARALKDFKTSEKKIIAYSLQWTWLLDEFVLPCRTC